MVKNTTRELVKMTGLCEGLRNLMNEESFVPEVREGFVTDKEKSHLIEVLSGTCMCATGWRENSESREVTGVVNVRAGEACLFLPGEPRFIKPSDGAEVSEFILD